MDSKKQKKTVSASPSNKGIKCHNMMYVQQLKYLPVGSVENLIKRIETNVLTVKGDEYALIVHDKDIGEEEHVQVMFCFKNAKYLSAVAKKLSDKPERMQKWDDRKENGYSYLLHRTKGAVDKGDHQYDPAEVKANFDFADRIEKIETDIQSNKQKIVNINSLLDDLYTGSISKSELESHLSGKQIACYAKKIDIVHAKCLERKAIEWREEMKESGKCVETVWIYGVAGTGKTRFAKQYARKLGRKYYVTGSSRDIFQQYEGEHTIIMDELRPKTIPYHDLLRILDPFGADELVMAPSRYADKALACDLIIITSPFSPIAFYNSIFRKGKQRVDSFEQLLRRLSLVIKMDADYIKAMHYNECTENFEVMPGGSTENTYSQPVNKSGSDNSIQIFKDMFC